LKFGPLTVTAPDDLEGFLRYNYPTLHRFTEEEQEKVNNHYPAALSFSTTPKQEL
jgi:lipopolysaccharide cholinephosphotransferase